MKKCEEVLELLSLYIDNELDEVTANAVEDHVKSCISCKAELEQLIEIVKMCNEIEEVELPDNFRENLHQKLVLEQENMIVKMQENKKTMRQMMRTVASVAAMFILVFAAYGIMRTGKFEGLFSFGTKSAPPNSDVLYSMSQEFDEQSLNKSLNKEKSENQIFAYDSEVGANSDNKTDDVYSFNMEPDNNDISITSVPVETPYPDSKSTDKVDNLELSEILDTKNGDHSIARQTDVIAAEPFINLTAYSNNFELDISYINEIASKYGTKIEENNFDSFNSLTVKPSQGAENMAFVIAGEPDYIVTYTMNKLSYDKFIKELNKKFKGEYYVTNDEKALNNRLKDVDKRIKELENSKKTDTDEYISLNSEKESILKQLDGIYSNDKIRIGIGVIRKQ